MNRLRTLLAVTAVLCLGTIAAAGAHKGGGSGGGHSGHSGHSSGRPGPGTGSSGSAVHVRGYTKRDGTPVDAHMRSKADGRFENNWTTKGNTNPFTGEPGRRVTPPARHGGSRMYRPGVWPTGGVGPVVNSGEGAAAAPDPGPGGTASPQPDTAGPDVDPALRTAFAERMRALEAEAEANFPMPARKDAPTQDFVRAIVGRERYVKARSAEVKQDLADRFHLPLAWVESAVSTGK